MIFSWREAHSSTGRLVTGGGGCRDEGGSGGGTPYKFAYNSLNFRTRNPEF